MRDSVRALARTPGLTTVIVVSLALGTGANAAVYSAVAALLFRGACGRCRSVKRGRRLHEPSHRRQLRRLVLP